MTTTTDTILETLNSHGFALWQTGGGCTAMGRQIGDAEILVTDESGTFPPEADDWLIGVYDGDERDEVALADKDEGSFAVVLAGAIDKAESLAMESAARRRGES